MKVALATVLVLSTLPLAAQQTGVAHPPEMVDDLPAPQQVAAPPADERPAFSKPSAAIPQTAVTVREAPAYQSPSATLQQKDLAAFNPDANIVTEVENNPHELPMGTLIRTRLKGSIETATTGRNTPFRVDITDPIEHNGRVVIPAGSVLHGRITQIRGGRRIGGAAAIHLEPERITLPDGTEYPIHAAVVDTDQYGSLRINSEGTLVRRDHAKETLAAMSLATGGAAAAGGVMGGPAGALVGAGVGAGVSTVWWLKQDHQTHLPEGSLLIWSLTDAMPIESLVREPEYAGTGMTRPAADGARYDGAQNDDSREMDPSGLHRRAVAPPAPAPQTTAPQSFVPTN